MQVPQSKWQKFKENTKLIKFLEWWRRKIRLSDYLFFLVMFGWFYYFRESYLTVWNSNEESLLLAFPFLIFFAWLVWRDRHHDKTLSREILLSAAGVFLAAWIFIFQTTEDNASKLDLIKTANTYNCQTAAAALTVNPANGLLLQPFEVNPYLENSDIVLSIYGNARGIQILEAAFAMESENGLINLVGGLSVQAVNPGLLPYANQLMSKYNSQLIQNANIIGNLICTSPPQQQSWLAQIRHKISSFFKQ